MRQTVRNARDAVERWLEAERDQLVLWLPVMLGAGSAAWFVLAQTHDWIVALLFAAAVAAGAMAAAGGGRAAMALAMAAAVFALGLTLAWARAERVAAPVLARPLVATLAGRVVRIEPLPARELTRVTLDRLRWQQAPDPAPVRIRVNLPADVTPAGLTAGATLSLRARLMPPPPPAVPGAYDFARVAWFDGIGATGRGFAPITIVSPGAGDSGVRQRLTAHIQAQLPGSAGGIAAALATGDPGAIAEDDAEAMRRAGLAHLLSVSGLHITAAVGIVMWLAMRLLALSPRLALTGRVPLLAAALGALAAIGYTWITGAQVPTIRSCVAALMVLTALALGREAVTLRLVAVGALVVLIAWPEAIVSPSFQLSFAAVTAIVALHEHPRVRATLLPRDEDGARKLARHLASLLLTGVVVEVALMPIAAYHFHKAGLFGALANIVAIPLTTFVVMPAEAIALVLDAISLGWPAWRVTGAATDVLLWIARTVAALPGAVTALPQMPSAAFGLMVAGELWIALWRTRWRRAGIVPLAVGAAWALLTPAPDLIVSSDGRHLAWRDATGGLSILRDRTGDYMRDTLAQGGGLDGEPALLSNAPGARCNRDLCAMERMIGDRSWRVLATRSGYLIPTAQLIPRCAAADVVVSDRRLPRRCRARWLTLDRPALARTGGITITFATARATTVNVAGDAHPWRRKIMDDRTSRLRRKRPGIMVSPPPGATPVE